MFRARKPSLTRQACDPDKVLDAPLHTPPAPARVPAQTDATLAGDSCKDAKDAESLVGLDEATAPLRDLAPGSRDASPPADLTNADADVNADANAAPAPGPLPAHAHAPVPVATAEQTQPVVELIESDAEPLISASSPKEVAQAGVDEAADVTKDSTTAPENDAKSAVDFNDDRAPPRDAAPTVDMGKRITASPIVAPKDTMPALDLPNIAAVRPIPTRSQNVAEPAIELSKPATVPPILPVLLVKDAERSVKAHGDASPTVEIDEVVDAPAPAPITALPPVSLLVCDSERGDVTPPVRRRKRSSCVEIPFSTEDDEVNWERRHRYRPWACDAQAEAEEDLKRSVHEHRLVSAGRDPLIQDVLALFQDEKPS